jgi:hypothetical protein
MPQTDMSARAVTARLKLVSQLRRLCLSLRSAKVEARPVPERENLNKSTKAPKASPK